MRAEKPAWVDGMQTMGKMCRFGIFPLMAGATLLLAVWGNMLAGAERAATPTLPNSAADARARVTAAAASWPLRFEENAGQIQGPEARDVRYVSRGSAYTLFLTSTEAVLVLRQGAEKGAGKTSPVVLRMRLSGSNQSPGLMGQDELPSKSNYFIGNDPSKWRTGVANFGRVAAKGVYPGIDLVYHGNQGQLEYDFEVAPQADPERIRFALEGARGLRIDSQGDLLVKVEGGELRFRRPRAYQKADGAERSVPVRYVLKGKNQVEFRLASYDKRQPLIIDPVLAYSTYLGGSSIDTANGIAVAPDGSAFIAGGTFSGTNFPTVHTIFPYAGEEDAFVAKISPDGSTLLYSTYLGGASYDVANAIAVDAAGEAFVTGTTTSTNFPVANGFDGLCGDDGKCGATWNPQGFIVSNAFVTKLNTAGSALVYSSYLGYYENVQGHGIAVDGALNAYVTGEVGPNIAPTVTITPPLTPPPPFCPQPPNPLAIGFQPWFGGSGSTEYGGVGTDAFIVKIDASASEILYCSYLGGSDEDVGYGIAVDSSANAYVTGLTYSDDFPLTATATYTSTFAPVQTTYAGAGDAFVSKVSTTGTGETSLLYSTYLGGSGLDQGNGVAVDTSGNAYVVGTTTSIDTTLGFTEPVLPEPPLPGHSNCALDAQGVCEGDAFVAELDPAASGTASLLYFTYLGGSLADSGTGIALDPSDNVYITGSTVSSNGALVPFPIAGTVFQPVYGGGNADAFVAELTLTNPPSTALVYSSYLGGSNTDTGAGIAVDVNGGAYVTGQTCSLDFPLANPLQATPGGNCDAFVSKIVASGGVELSPAGLIFPLQSVNTMSTAQTVTLTNGAATTLTINSISLGGTDAADFAQTNTCDGSVLAGNQCTFTVTFTPQAVGTFTAHITVTDNVPAANSTQVIDLTGTGGNLPTVSLSAITLAFGNQPVGVTSAPQVLTVTNTGTAALNISTIVASGDFAVQSSTCTTPLQATTPPSNCTINVTFTPSAAGSSVGSLTLTDNAPNSPQIILLTGTGVLEPVVSLSANSLNFAAQIVGSTSAPQTITVTNTGTAALTISGVSASAGFAETSTCGSPVAPNGFCTISVTFTPTAAGSVLGSVSLTDNAPGSPQVISLLGTGTLGPIVSLSDTNLTFAPQNVGTTSAPQTVTLTNTGSAPLEIFAIAPTGNFAQTNTCPSTLAAGANCTISVTFTPAAAGNLYGSVTIADSAANSPQTITLGGVGVSAPAVSLSASTLSFGSETVNATTAAQIVTVTNTGTATLTPLTIAATGPFVQTNTCGASLAAGAICTISVTFTPTAAGSAVSTVTLTDNAGSSPQVISLSGVGVTAPIASLSPASVTFATSQAVGTTSTAQTVTLTNNASLPATSSNALIIAGITTSANFGTTNTCGASLAAQASCSISVTFTPTAVGNLYGTLTVTDNNNGAPASTQVVPLAGVGLGAPAVSLSASTLAFGSQAVSTTSAAQIVTLTNTGSAALTLTSITATAPFAETNTCGAALAAGGTCTISVTFTPTTAGSAVGTVTLVDNAGNTPQTIALSGTGVTAPIASLSPASVTFAASQAVGTTSAAQVVTLTNNASLPATSSNALIITGITTSSNFGTTNNCGASLAAQASCSISVTFTPTVVGNLYGTLTVTDNNNGAAASTQVVPLAGVGLGAPAVSLSASTLGFGSQIVNSTSAAQIVTLTNSGTAALTLTSITPTAPFAQTNTCGASLAAGGVCTISVTFTPTAAGNAVGSVTLVDNAGNTPQVISLSGTGITAPIASLSPASVTFATSQAVGTTSAAQTVTLSNTGSTALTITGITASANFGATNNCGASVAAGTSCSISVTFTPTAVGNLYGTLTVTDNNNGAAASTQVVPLAGVGLGAPAVSLSAITLTFSAQIVNSTSAAQTVTLTNTGTAVLTLTSITPTAPFAQTNTCGASLAAGAICTISVTFTPTAAGSAVGSVTLVDNAGSSPQTIALNGTGTTAPIANLSPASVTFATSQAVGTTSAAQTVTLANTGSAPLIIAGITASANFATTNNCGASVPAPGSCSISVTFTPTAAGNLYGTLSLTDNNNGTTGSTQVVALAGTGVGAPLVSPSATSLAFGNQALGATSAPLVLTVTNTGTAALTITAVTASGDFAVASNNCTVPLQATTPASNCTITVTFTPTVVGSRVGALTLTDNAANSPQVYVLTGTGVAQPIVGLSPTTLSFGSQALNTTSLPLTVTVSNSGTAALTFASVTASGPFAVPTNTCGASLAVGGACAISVTFTPTTDGAAVGSVTLTDNAANSPQTISLTGTGISAPLASLSPLSLTFPTEPLQTTSAAQTVTLTNTGNASLLVTGIVASTNFGVTTTCGASIAVGATCNISVTFTPTAVGNIFGTLTVTDNSNGTVGTTQTVALEGTGLGGPVASLSASALTFAAQAVNTTSPVQSITLTNSGTATMTNISIAISGDFSQTNTCTGSLAASSACIINVVFTPTVLGTRTGALTITDSAPNSPQMVALTGGGADFGVSITPTSATVVAGNSTSVTVSVSSMGGYATAVTLSCGGLPALATCTASPASVTPSSTGPVTSTMTLSTTRRTSAPPGGLPWPPGPAWTAHPWFWVLWGLLLLGLSGWAARKNRLLWRWAVLALAALWLVNFAACGAGGIGYTNPTGTPAGTYTITVTGTSAGLSHSTNLTLTVQ